MIVSRPQAGEYAGRLGACFPRPAIPAETLVEWAEEFVGLDDVTAVGVLERIKERYDRPPTIRQLRSAVAAERNATVATVWQYPDPEPWTVEEWAAENPEKAAKLVKVLPGGVTAQKILEASKAGKLAP